MNIFSTHDREIGSDKESTTKVKLSINYGGSKKPVRMRFLVEMLLVKLLLTMQYCLRD